MKLLPFSLLIGCMLVASSGTIAYAKTIEGEIKVEDSVHIEDVTDDSLLRERSARDVSGVGVHDVIRRDIDEIKKSEHVPRGFFSSGKGEAGHSFLGSLIKRDAENESGDHDSIRERARKNFEVGIRNLENIMMRLTSRVDTINESGNGNATLDTLMTDAEDSLTNAKDKVSAITTLLSSASATKESVQALAVEARNALMETRTALMNVVESIKGIQSEVTENSDSAVAN
jgi:hypothetical protein